MENAISADTLDAKQHAQRLLDELGPEQIAAVLQILEIMAESPDEPLTEEDRRAVAASRNPEGGVSLEEVAAECGLTMN
jgi:hypothetical protein